MKSLFLNKNVSTRVENGHPWIFANEINRGKALDAAAKPGEVVNVFTHDKRFIGRGYANPQSQIMVRLLTRDKGEAIDAAFFHRKICDAWAYRQKLGYTENCRLVFGEADGIPQLIIDKFNDHFVVQTLALGIDTWKPEIVQALNEIFSPKGIYERNDVPVRELEGMEQIKGFLSAPFDTLITIRENGIRFNVDLQHGQKTGFFLDQQDNRFAIRNLVREADVLGAFCYTGSFEISAAVHGAKSVLGIDISEQAIAMCIKNAELNDVTGIANFQCLNAFDALKDWTREGRQWDVVMLDPPSFTKNRSSIDKAVSGYKEINLRGIKLVRPGGFLVTSSCTSLVNPGLFLDTVNAAAKDARRRIRRVMLSSQSADHPIIPDQENTHYLKFLVVQVL